MAELDKLDPQPGEEAALDAARRLMQAAARIGEDIARAQQALGPEGAEGPMLDALRWLEGAADRAEGVLDAAVAALARALDELAEAERGGRPRRWSAMEFDPAELERVEERLFAIRALARKHAVLPEALPDLAAGLRSPARGAGRRRRGGSRRCRRQVAAARGRLCAPRRRALSAQPRRGRPAAGHGDGARNCAPLKLERAVFATDARRRAEPGPEGPTTVDLHASRTNPGAPAGPLNRIASGGELSRFLLALKVCLSARAEGLTMIFDEIDRGVGGATADAVGRRLEALAGGGAGAGGDAFAAGRGARRRITGGWKSASRPG